MQQQQQQQHFWFVLLFSIVGHFEKVALPTPSNS